MDTELLDKELLDGCICGNFDKVKSSLELGADIETLGEHNRTPLIEAICGFNNKTKYDIVSFLIEKGANVNAKDKYGNSVLKWTCNKNIFEIVKLLINNDADINGKDKDGNTILMITALLNHLNIFKYLIKSGADLNIKNRNNRDIFNIINNNKHLTKISDYLKSDVYIDNILGLDYDYKLPRKQKIIDAVKIDPSIINKLDENELKDIPELQHILKSDEYGLFENKIMNFQIFKNKKLT